MMICTSMHLEYDVSMHGWAIRHRTTHHDLPLPIIIFILCHLAYPPKSLAMTIHKMAPWHLQGKPCVIQRKRVKKYKKPVGELQNKAKGQTL